MISKKTTQCVWTAVYVLLSSILTRRSEMVLWLADFFAAPGFLAPPMLISSRIKLANAC